MLDIYTLHRHKVQGVLKVETEEDRSPFLVFLLSLSADIQGIDKDIMLQNERSDKSNELAYTMIKSRYSLV